MRTSSRSALEPALQEMSEPSFEHDILPLFRPEDIEEMSFAFDLSSFASVREHAEQICARLSEGTMPCDGAWPAGDVERFRRWIDAGTPA
jgi:hypothetical protein